MPKGTQDFLPVGGADRPVASCRCQCFRSVGEVGVRLTGRQALLLFRQIGYGKGRRRLHSRQQHRTATFGYGYRERERERERERSHFGSSGELCLEALHRGGDGGLTWTVTPGEPSRFSQRCLSPTPAATLLKGPAAPGRRVCNNRRRQVRSSYLADHDRDTARSSTRKAGKGAKCGGHLRLRDRDLGKNGDWQRSPTRRPRQQSLEH